MRVNLSSTELSSLLPNAEAATKTATLAGTSFAALHAESLARYSSASPSGGGRGATETSAGGTAGTDAQRAAAKTPKPKDETYQPVQGQLYEEIVSGPRNGMFINRSGNARDGEAFVLVKRNGREFHIYGSGADRQVIALPTSDTPPATSVTGGELRVRGTTYRDVPGRAFDEIVSGPRNGMFINRSGNSRDGKAFILVERPDGELHIYGSGKHRLVVRVVPPELRKDSDATAIVPKTEATTPSTEEAKTPLSAPVAGTPSSGSSILLS